MTPLDDDDLDLRLLLARRGLASRAEAWPALLGVQALRETEPPSYYAELVCMVDEAPTRTDHFICLGACEETSVRVAHIAYAKLLQRLVQPADGERIAHGVAY